MLSWFPVQMCNRDVAFWSGSCFSAPHPLHHSLLRCCALHALTKRTLATGEPIGKLYEEVLFCLESTCFVSWFLVQICNGGIGLLGCYTKPPVHARAQELRPDMDRSCFSAPHPLHQSLVQCSALHALATWEPTGKLSIWETVFCLKSTYASLMSSIDMY